MVDVFFNKAINKIVQDAYEGFEATQKLSDVLSTQTSLIKYPSNTFPLTVNTFDNNLYGLASLTADLLTKGTKNRTASEIAEEIDFLGASLSAGADWDGSYINLYCLKKHLNKAVSVLSDVILNPVFDISEIKRIKDQRISSIIQAKDDTSNLSDKLFNRVAGRADRRADGLPDCE